MPGELLVKPTPAMQIDPAAGGGKNDINLYLIVGLYFWGWGWLCCGDNS